MTRPMDPETLELMTLKKLPGEEGVAMPLNATAVSTGPSQR